MSIEEDEKEDEMRASGSRIRVNRVMHVRPSRVIMAFATSPIGGGPTRVKDKSASLIDGMIGPLFHQILSREHGHAQVGIEFGRRGSEGLPWALSALQSRSVSRLLVHMPAMYVSSLRHCISRSTIAAIAGNRSFAYVNFKPEYVVIIACQRLTGSSLNRENVLFL